MDMLDSEWLSSQSAISICHTSSWKYASQFVERLIGRDHFCSDCCYGS